MAAAGTEFTAAAIRLQVAREEFDVAWRDAQRVTRDYAWNTPDEQRLSEGQQAALMGVDRMTIRKWLLKRLGY